MIIIVIIIKILIMIMVGCSARSGLPEAAMCCRAESAGNEIQEEVSVPEVIREWRLPLLLTTLAELVRKPADLNAFLLFLLIYLHRLI